MKCTLCRLIIVLILIQSSAEIACSQSFKFKNFGVQEGICDPYIYTINQDENGFIWLGTGEGLCKYDGFEFIKLDDTLGLGMVNSSFIDSRGILWFGYSNGSVSYYKNNKLNVLSGIDAKSVVIDFTEVENNTVLALTQNDGIILISKDLNVQNIKEPFNTLLSSFTYLGNNKLLIATFESIGIYDIALPGGVIANSYTVSELDYIVVQKILYQEKDRTAYLGTQDEGIYKLTLEAEGSDSYKLVKVLENTDLSSVSVQDILVDDEDKIWISTTRNGVFKLSQDNGNKLLLHIPPKGPTGNIVKDIYKDKENNIWFGTYGNGLDKMLNQAFVFYQDANVRSVCRYNNEILYGKNGVILSLDTAFSGEAKIKYSSANALPADDNITALHENNQTLWVGTENSGLFYIKSSSSRAVHISIADNSLGNSINHIQSIGDILWIATKDGVVKYNTVSGELKRFSTREGLTYNNISSIYIHKEGDAWVLTQGNSIYAINENDEIVQKLSVNGAELEFVSMDFDNLGNIWLSTYGNGVFKFSKDSVFNITTQIGLKSNFCYSIIFDGEENVWVGHRNGLSKIDIKSRRVKAYGPEEGFEGDFQKNAILYSQGIVYFGTNKGLIAYNPLQNKINLMPPQLNLVKVLINEKPAELYNGLVLPYGIYKIQVSYVGLSYSAPDAVKYQIMLKGKGFDDNFGAFTKDKMVTYNNIRDGEYEFVLNATNEVGVEPEFPLAISFKVKKPFWKTWWFITLASVVLVLTVYVIIRIRERKQKQLQEYLEAKLVERTKEVVEQKEEIELKNRDITDSINYAQRIQASILPSINKLQSNFSGSFVFYQPRDIVSGDFYWFDRIKDNRFVIVCADSTGHGVPGAFMSMIGTTLIKDICLREDVNSPSEILFNLDLELKNTLNQNREAEKSNDGMDITVCEINLETNYLRFASAMRPMIIYKDGRELYLKGSRSSIGGSSTLEDKNFEESCHQLNKGDLIYMFSDGYPDQFGGPMGKKFKMVRLKNLLKDIHNMPMEEQFNHVRNTFNLWKDTLDQVDDVLFMGLKL